jgi:hypothetical protein
MPDRMEGADRRTDSGLKLGENSELWGRSSSLDEEGR